MKIQSEHYEHMKSAISTLAIQHPIAKYRIANPTFNDMRVRWDYCHAAGLTPWICANLYSYMNDEHIDTALRHIFADLEQELRSDILARLNSTDRKVRGDAVQELAELQSTWI